MIVLVINAGSSSLKYQLFDMRDASVLAKGVCERIGLGGKITHKTADGRAFCFDADMPNHTAAFRQVEKSLISGEGKVLDSMSEISAVGHRVVQGGAIYNTAVLLDEQAIGNIDSLCDLAPLHNPAHIQGIRACFDVLGPDVPEVAVFDTAFHQTIPQKAFMYGIPYEYYEKYKIRRYGFHGTSHRYASKRCAKILGVPRSDSKIITCHLGNGSSLCAVKNGKSVDTTMGFTPLDGFMMGTRSGSLDPSVVTFLAEKENLDPGQISDLLNKRSGALGISGVSSDERDVLAQARGGNPRARLSQEMMRYQIAKYIGGFMSVLNGVDGIAFTGGIGENCPDLREEVCEYFSYLGLRLDKEKNAKTMHGVETVISAPDSNVPVVVVLANEELVIARDAMAVIGETDED